MQRRSSNTSAVFTLPDPGELDKRIHLRQRSDQPSSDYGVEPVYQNEKDVWAKIRQVGATTYHESVQADDIITHYMTIRYRRGITSDFEVVSGGSIYRVKRLRDLNSAGRYLLLECEELGAEERNGDMYG
ncbi:phage head closure protein [Pantoea stewartii]|uniref:Phage head-tail adapter protein n=1 Tax=Pantoea stewartii TaxID=66269 RepID=A0AB34VHW7_9GAMM|nr:phage head closure protein [Pantoea stewartii]KTS70605.1 phage head-tail adapter protein [Pantoea stewartii]KTS99177.1 phage head-tail adapter protein [Pantoea stewartii]KTT07319.1 phage head-tail adapter protein [Pantoea stewartii]